MSDEVANSIWDDDCWFNFDNVENEEEFKDKDEKEKMVVAEMSKSAGNGTNGHQVVKAHEAVAVQPPPRPPRPPVVKGKGQKGASAAGTSGGGNGRVLESRDHELYLSSERERRKKLRDLFTNLHALLTHLPPKADNVTIVTEAATFIKQLQETLQTLEQQKLERFTAAVNNPLILNNPFINFNPFSFIPPQNLPTQSQEASLAELGSSSGNNNANNTAITLPNNQAAQIAFPAFFKTWMYPNVILSVFGKEAHINVCCPKKAGLLTAICFVMEKYKMELVTAEVSCDNILCNYLFHAQMNADSSDQSAEVEEIYKQAAEEIMSWITS